MIPLLPGPPPASPPPPQAKNDKTAMGLAVTTASDEFLEYRIHFRGFRMKKVRGRHRLVPFCTPMQGQTLRGVHPTNRTLVPWRSHPTHRAAPHHPLRRSSGASCGCLRRRRRWSASSAWPSASGGGRGDGHKRKQACGTWCVLLRDGQGPASKGRWRCAAQPAPHPRLAQLPHCAGAWRPQGAQLKQSTARSNSVVRLLSAGRPFPRGAMWAV